jgi:hypothetical protein
LDIIARQVTTALPDHLHLQLIHAQQEHTVIE